MAIGYAAVAFVVLQLGEIILPAFSAEWALQYVVVFSVLGFPLVMLLAWVFDITPEGIRKTEAIDASRGDLQGMPWTSVLPRAALLTVTVLTVGGVGLVVDREDRSAAGSWCFERRADGRSGGVQCG